MIDQAIDNIEKHLQAQINVLTTGRGIITNAAGFNALVEAKQHLIEMKPKKVKPKKKVVSTETTETADILVTCEYCKKSGLTALTYGRWHGDKCKVKLGLTES